MNRRFKATLMSLAVAAMSATAFANAPVISFIKSPIIVDDTPVSTPNWYVYPDAISLDTAGTDDNTATGSILWSYTGPGGVQGRYTINGRAALLTATEDPNAPGAKSLVAGDDTGVNGADVVGGGLRDGNVRTLTFRDSSLSILGGAGTNTPSGLGAGAQVSELLTLFASDGTTYSSQTFLVFTEEKGGVDRLLTPTAVTVTSVGTILPAFNGTIGWTTANFFGTTTFSSTTNNGLCLQVPLTGDNFGLWVSPFNAISLTTNSVYRVRLKMDDNTATALAAGLTPLWDFVIDNFDTNNPNTTENKYSGTWINLDNFSGAAATVTPNPNTAGKTTAAAATFDIWYAPLAIQAADWNDTSAGEFIASRDNKNDMRMIFRVLDVNITANVANLDAGTLCIRAITVSKIPLNQLRVNQNLYDVSNITTATHSVAGIFATQVVGAAAVTNAHTVADYTGGSLTVSPNTGGTFTDGTVSGAHAWDVEVVAITPGNTVTRGSGGVAADNDDNWPFTWTPNQLLMGTMVATAANAQGAVNPPDGLQMSWDSPSTEILNASIQLSTSNVLGMPKTTPTTYTSFFFTHAGSNEAAAVTNHDNRLRITAGILNNLAINSGGAPQNTGGVKFTRFRVDQMDLPSN